MSTMDDATIKIKSFVADQCLKPFICLCRKLGNFRFQFGRVVSMNQAGVLAEGTIVDDEGHRMRQVFMDQNLVECSCPSEDGLSNVRVVFSNDQRSAVGSKAPQCLLLGAEVDEHRLLMNHDAAAVVALRSGHEFPEDAFLSQAQSGNHPTSSILGLNLQETMQGMELTMRPLHSCKYLQR